AAHAIHLPGLCAETASQLTVVAFGKQMNVQLPQLRTEGVGILGFLNAATPVDAQPIGLTLGQLTDGQPRYLLLHEAQGVSLAIEQLHLQSTGLPGPHDDPVPLLVGSEKREGVTVLGEDKRLHLDRKSTRLNSSHVKISYAVLCL